MSTNTNQLIGAIHKLRLQARVGVNQMSTMLQLLHKLMQLNLLTKGEIKHPENPVNIVYEWPHSRLRQTLIMKISFTMRHHDIKHFKVLSID